MTDRLNSIKGVKVFFFLVFICLSCRSGNLPADSLLISLEKTPCFGTCEAYKLEIFSSGLIKFNGISNHKMLGNFEARLEMSALENLIEQFRNAEFFNYKSQYVRNDSDIPTTYLYFKDQGIEKIIQHNYNPPKKLQELQQLLEKLIEDLKWKEKP